VFWFVVVSLVFSQNAKGENVAEDLQKFESQTIVKERKKSRKLLQKVMRAWPMALGMVLRRV
jgi:hypothetical protein